MLNEAVKNSHFLKLAYMDNNTSNPNKNDISLISSSRLFGKIFIILSAVVCTIYLSFAYQNWLVNRKQMLHEEQLRLKLAVDVIERELNQVISDLQQTAQSHDLLDYINRYEINNRDPINDSNKQPLQQTLLNLSKHEPAYDQIRVLDMKGYELLRINHNGPNPFIVEEANLQNKSNRYYFRDMENATSGQIYISPIDLNVEHNVVELPIKPMLRIGTPLINAQGERTGILLFNYLPSYMLSHLLAVMEDSPGDVLLLDKNGYWLQSVKSKKQRMLLIADLNSFKASYPSAWEVIEKHGQRVLDSTESTEGYFSFATLSPNLGRHHSEQGLIQPLLSWIVISRIDPPLVNFSVFRTVNENRDQILILLVCCFIVSAVIVNLIISNRSKKLQLRSSEEQFKQLIKVAPDGIFIADLNGCYVDVNQAGCDMVGWLRDEIVGKYIKDFLPEKDMGRLQKSKAHLLQGGTDVGEWFFRHKSGNFIPVEVSANISPDGRWLGFVRDISKRKEVEFQMRLSSTVIENTQEAVLVTDAHKNIISVNPAFTSITGYDADEVIGKNPNFLQSGKHSEAFYRELWHSLATKGQWEGEIWNRRKDGEIFPAWENICVSSDDQGKIINYISIMADITVLKENEQALNVLAYSDPLTKLANRTASRIRLEQSLSRAKRNNQKVAVLLLDLNRFKLINDTLGHDTGDIVLKTVAWRLKKCVRDEDTVARLGGDEFEIILEQIDQEQGAVEVVRKIIKTICEPIELASGEEVFTSTSVGISIFPDNAKNAKELEKAADIAMYRAKKAGTQSFEFFTPNMTLRAENRMSIERDLRRALADNQFKLFYQPQVDISSGEIIGVEALLRWHHPEKGLINPEDFIKIAEETRLIHQLGKWVIGESCKQMNKWLNAGCKPVRMGINVSGFQLMYDHVVEDLKESLQTIDLTQVGSLIQIEVTESWLQMGGRVNSILEELCNMGVSLAIDDFGTGYSSLSQLKALPIDTLKIDRSFLENIPEDSQNSAIVTAIISMAQSLDLTIIAEGVETIPQLTFLLGHSCNEVQGFLFSKAVNGDAMEKLLHESPFASQLDRAVQADTIMH